MSYDINWFENNMKPVVANTLGDCSSCCLRNLNKDLFCKKLTCVDKIGCHFVFWDTKNPGQHRGLLMGLLSKDMIEWFSKTSVEHAQEITANMINKALQNCKQYVK